MYSESVFSHKYASHRNFHIQIQSFVIVGIRVIWYVDNHRRSDLSNSAHTANERTIYSLRRRERVVNIILIQILKHNDIIGQVLVRGTKIHRRASPASVACRATSEVSTLNQSRPQQVGHILHRQYRHPIPAAGWPLSPNKPQPQSSDRR